MAQLHFLLLNKMKIENPPLYFKTHLYIRYTAQVWSKNVQILGYDILAKPPRPNSRTQGYTQTRMNIQVDKKVYSTHTH